MSSATPTPTSTTSSSNVSASASSTTSSSSNNGYIASNPGLFYKNLFYILIGLLCAFAIVSFLSLARARRRRRAIISEAARLGVVVPGVPGYIPIRDRVTSLWSRADGTNNPDWWEVHNIRSNEKEMVQGDINVNTIDQYDNFETEELRPIGIIPVQAKPAPVKPVPVSRLPYFPNHLAYRPDEIITPTARFSSLETEPEQLNQLIGERIEVITVIKMPCIPIAPKRKDISDDDDSEQVIREWGGIELGIAAIKVGQ